MIDEILDRCRIPGLGFADQAHLTRVIGAAVGHTPRQLRRLLADRRESGQQQGGAGVSAKRAPTSRPLER